MDFILACIGLMFEAMAGMFEVAVYAIHAVWVTIIQASLSLMDAVDDWLIEIDIVDNPLLRLLVMGVVGFLIGVVLMIFVCFMAGYWAIPLVLALTMGFCMFVGLVADPDRDWSLGDFPGSSGRSGPKMPLNL